MAINLRHDSNDVQFTPSVGIWIAFILASALILLLVPHAAAMP